MRAHPSPDYISYIASLCDGEPSVVVDICGTGWSLNRLVEYLPDPAPAIFLVHHLEIPLRGYYEHQQATRLQEDSTWVPAARGKVVKLVAHLVPFLPPGREYRLVMMRRDLKDVVASQRTMLMYGCPAWMLNLVGP